MVEPGQACLSLRPGHMELSGEAGRQVICDPRSLGTSDGDVSSPAWVSIIMSGRECVDQVGADANLLQNRSSRLTTKKGTLPWDPADRACLAPAVCFQAGICSDTTTWTWHSGLGKPRQQSWRKGPLFLEHRCPEALCR